ncbi:MAG: tandem-95 repeat protein [Sedimentisphaerales bacterium]|nr:tandem-95 repeat protein [Sedimentisphaerales bacterium]
MRMKRWSIGLTVLVMLAGWGSYTWADVAATVNPALPLSASIVPATPGDPSVVDGRVFGWRFFVTKAMTITHIGLFAMHGPPGNLVDDGLNVTHTMGIWGVRRPSAGGGLDLLRGPLSIGPGGTVENHYVYVSVGESLMMTPNDLTYDRLIIGVWTGMRVGDLYGQGNTDLFYHSPEKAQTLTAHQVDDIELQNYTCYYKSVNYTDIYTSGTFTAPWGRTLDADEYFALNFKYTTNAAPIAADDSAPTQMNAAVTVDVLANDSDPEGDPLSLTSCTQGSKGTVAIAGSSLTYTPNMDAYGIDTFTYTISDGHGNTATATVTVTINRPPVAAPDAAQTEVGQAITICVLNNDHDDDGDALTVTGVGQPASGSAALNADGTVTYTPNTWFTGQDAFSYTISDGKGGTSSADVTVVVNPKDVLIDIKPGSYPNSINLGSNGVVPVAILSTAGFDAMTVDPATVSLAGAGVAVRGKGNRFMANNQDVNADGLLDLVLHVETENLDPSELQDGYGTVTGTTYTGVPIIGTDEITIVPAH